MNTRAASNAVEVGPFGLSGVDIHLLVPQLIEGEECDITTAASQPGCAELGT